MASEPVHPLRISKSSPSTGSPTKMASGVPRPLSEISPTAQRRNSPSWNQTSKSMGLNHDSSPFQSSPLEKSTSPRLFWQSRSTENALYGGRNASPSPMRRASIERVQRASRVKNSNILALEQKQQYDPARVTPIERPLAKMQGNAFGGNSTNDVRSGFSPERKGHQRSQSKTDIPFYSPTKTSFPSSVSSMAVSSAAKEQTSPVKSSLSTSRFKSSYDAETGSWNSDPRSEDDTRSFHRHAKSVTFDAAPPQVNEYEMATPDLSSVGSNSREGSYETDEDEDDSVLHHYADSDIQDDSFDASLEDTDKTPVVGPDDWRQESPARGADLRYENSPGPDVRASHPLPGRPDQGRSDSSASNGDSRPLPPLPGQLARTHSHTSSTGLSATAERMLGAHRGLPSPPPATAGKEDVPSIGSGKMTLEERLKLMMLSDDGHGKTAAEQQRERRLRRGGPRDRFESQTPEREQEPALPVADPLEADEEDDTLGDISGLEEYRLPARISRESIMRRVNGNMVHERESDYRFSSPGLESSPARVLPLDPDVPIPSTEDSLLTADEAEADGSVIIHRDAHGQEEEDEDEDDVSFSLPDIPDMQLPKMMEEVKRSGSCDSVSRYSDSHYSDGGDARDSKGDTVTPPPVQSTIEADHSTDTIVDAKEEELTKTISNPTPPPVTENAPSMVDARSYLQRPYTPDRQVLSKPEYDGSGWGDPEEFDDEYESSTPESVIHHRIYEDGDEEVQEPPTIPEQIATIKASSGSKLKTRPSATPSDIAAMREARRQVSREIPPIPDRHRDHASKDTTTAGSSSSAQDFLERHPSFKERSLTLDLDLGLSLDQDFDRVIEAQKVAFNQFIPVDYEAATSSSRTGQASGEATSQQSTSNDVHANTSPPKQRGYLMRQNTKLVAASDKESDDSWMTRSAGNSPVKTDRPQSWTVEPWNGRTRPKSVRSSRRPVMGPAPPLPGQESNAAALNPLAEEDTGAELATEEAGERGRLFVKVMGVKDLDLPMPRAERTWFSLTLDNGVHCVTTAWLELARNAPIGQEFELVVPNDLEFQLTLNVKLERPAPRVVQAASPIKLSKPKTSTFSRVFASPKKRKEMEMRHREEEERLAQQQRDAHARQLNTPPTAWDLLSPLVAEDGSFARSYVCLKEHETRCFGRPYMVEVACFNEWATEEANFASSVKSKRGNNAVVRRAPYKIGKLELQLLFVPRPKGSSDEDMPKSMNSCIRELKAAEERASRNWEGHLSQQGGDCPYWRRRYFKLVGPKLTAYHEATRQPRATINLGNAKRLIDDRRALTERETTGKGGRRRRSAFAEEEEGYMFVEEGFRIRFNNGEVIDFYADTAGDKEGWLKVLGEVIGRSDGGMDDDSLAPRKGKWCELVLKRENSLRQRSEGRRVHSRTKSMYL